MVLSKRTSVACIFFSPVTGLCFKLTSGQISHIDFVDGGSNCRALLAHVYSISPFVRRNPAVPTHRRARSDEETRREHDPKLRWRRSLASDRRVRASSSQATCSHLNCFDGPYKVG